MLKSSLATGFADPGRLLPIGGSHAELASLDSLSVELVARARQVDAAHHEGMWRTWMLDALLDVEQRARAAAALALSVANVGDAVRAAVEKRTAGLDAFMAKYRPLRP
jgi:hypothetical protein